MLSTRRSFLKGVLALGVASTLPLPSFGASLPIIYSDGIHDDTLGLNAMFAGEPFHVETEGIIAKNGVIRSGNFIISAPLIVGRDDFWMSETSIGLAPEFEGDTILQILGRHGYFANNVVTHGRDTHKPLRPIVYDARRVEFRV
jgi:hypothetical protein